MKLGTGILLLIGTLSSAAHAHPGHVAEQAGHNHLIAFTALTAAVLTGAGLAVRRKLHRRRAKRGALQSR